MSNEQVVEAMLVLGGTFIQHLARTWQVADRENQARLKAAFADEWDRYAELAALKAAQVSR